MMSLGKHIPNDSPRLCCAFMWQITPWLWTKKACFLTTASPICLRMLMGWQVAQHITILQQLLKHILALKHSWHVGQYCCVGHGRTKRGCQRGIKMELSWNNESGSMLWCPNTSHSKNILSLNQQCFARVDFDYCEII